MRIKLTLALAFALALSVFASGCSKKEDPNKAKWDEAASAAAASPPPSSSVPKLATGTFNKFFPKDGAGGYARVFTADKEGYAEAKLQKDGKDVATVTISDAAQVPDAKTKFAGATEKVSGHPAIKFGNNQTSVLVKDRYQVKASSTTLDHEARKALIATFDLGGLAQL